MPTRTCVGLPVPREFMFVCPKCGTSLGETGPTGVLEAVCSGCRYKFQVMRGRVVELTSSLATATAQHVFTSRARPYVRAYELRRSRYLGLAKTHLHHVAIAAAINLKRLVDWISEPLAPRARRSRFAALRA